MHRVEDRPPIASPKRGLSRDDFAQQIRARLHLRSCRFEAFPFDRLLPRIEPDEIVLPPDEPGTRPYADWLPEDGIELPVRRGDLTLGRFVLVPHRPTCGVALDPSARADAIEIASHAADALIDEKGIRT